jgi:hypothetical protein
MRRSFYLSVLALVLIMPYIIAGVSVKRGPGTTRLLADSIVFCGNTDNATQVFVGPARVSGANPYTTYFSNANVWQFGSTNCTASGSATEATADYPLLDADLTNPAIRVHGFYCFTDATLTAAMTLTFRDDAADTTPVITCDIPAAGNTCSATSSEGTPIVAEDSHMSIRAQYTDDLSATGNDLWCKVYFSVE